LAAGSRLGIGDSSEFKGVGNHGLNQDAFLLERSGSVFSANVRDERPLLASGEAPAREADQQETCQKSRRDGGLLDRSVRIFSDADGLVSGMQIGDICIGTIQRLPNDIAHKTLSEDHHSANAPVSHKRARNQ